MKNRDCIPLPVLFFTNIHAEVTNLRSKGISAVSLTSETNKGEKSEVSISLSSCLWGKANQSRRFWETCHQSDRRIVYFIVGASIGLQEDSLEHVSVSATPEKLCTQHLMHTLATVYSNGQLSRLVIDEVWLFPEYGWADLYIPLGTLYLREFDFRTSYCFPIYHAIGMGSWLQSRIS